MSAQILVVDDEGLIRQSLRTALAQEGFGVSTAASGKRAEEQLRAERPDIILLDLVLGDMDGLDLLGRIRQEAPESKVLVITAHGSIEAAVRAMKLGAYDFIRKPFEIDEIIATVRNALRTSSLERRVAYLAEQERRRSDVWRVVVGSAALQRVVDEARLIARSPTPVVLVLGESGVGKQLIARLIHDASDRAAGPYVELNCSAIPENLVESELFGHERGAFSDARDRKLGLVELADGGTLLLNEVGDLGAAAQSKLLTFLEQRTFRRLGSTALRQVDARIIAATNRDLTEMVAARSFREDLLYRLNAMTLVIPPLRERPEDIAALAVHFLLEASRDLGRSWKEIAPASLGILQRHLWPGNVRELRAVINRAALMQDAVTLLPEHLPAAMVAAAFAPPPPVPAQPGALPPGIPTLAEVELAHIRRVLDFCAGNRTQAAQLLGITRQTLIKKIGSTDDAGGPAGASSL